MLGCLHENKGALIRMFTSNEWKSSKFVKTTDGKIVERWDRQLHRPLHATGYFLKRIIPDLKQIWK